MTENQPRRPWLITAGLYLSIAAGAFCMLLVASAALGVRVVPFVIGTSEVSAAEFLSRVAVFYFVQGAVLLAIAALIVMHSRHARTLMMAYWIVAFVCELLRKQVANGAGNQWTLGTLILFGVAYLYLYRDKSASAWFAPATT